MDLKDYLTSERVCKKFQSTFELVNYAIGLAANMITTGRDCRVKTESQSRATQILNEILNNKDYLDEINSEPVNEPVKENTFTKPLSKKEGAEILKPSERKKMRRVNVD